MIKTWIREPLVQFFFIGTLIFGLYSLPGNRTRPETDTRINITAGDIEQLRAMFVKQRQRPPTEDELRGLIDARVQEEVLYREALAMGWIETTRSSSAVWPRNLSFSWKIWAIPAIPPMES